MKQNGNVSARRKASKRSDSYHTTTIRNEPPNTRAQRRAHKARANRRAVAALALVIIAAGGTVGLRSLANEASKTPRPDVTNTQVPTTQPPATSGAGTSPATLPIGTVEDDPALNACRADGLDCNYEAKPDGTSEVIGTVKPTTTPNPDIPSGVAEGGSAHNGDFPTEIPSTTTSTIPSGGSTHTECGGMVC